MTRRSLYGCALVLLVLCGFLPAENASKPPVTSESVEKAMDRPLERPAFRGALAAAVRKLQRQAGVTIEVDWKTLAAVGVTKDAKVDVKAPKATPGRLLSAMLAQAGGKKPLAWYIDDGKVRVTLQAAVLAKKSRITLATAPVKAAVNKENKSATSRAVTVRLDFKDTPLSDTLDFLAAASGANFYVNWKSLADVGITEDTPVTVKTGKVDIGKALDLVTAAVSGNAERDNRVYWVVDDGIVTVATGSALNQELHTRIYDVADLLAAVPNFKAPRMNLSSRQASTGANETSGESLFPDAESSSSENTEDGSRAAQRKQSKEKLIGIIKHTLPEDMWQPSGKGSVRVIRGKLIISQTLLGFKLMGESHQP